MFTGLVQHVGDLRSRSNSGSGVRFELVAPGLVPELAPGDSVAVDGVCLTATEIDTVAGSFAVDAVPTTLERTTLADMEPGRQVNLERAVRAGEPLGGHIVQGHVDGVGVVTEVSRDDEALVLGIRLPDAVARFTVARGSLTVDGVSLTVAGLSDGVAKLAIIPYTLGHTNLGRLKAGALVNLEADVIAKYVARLLTPYRPDDEEGSSGD
ncbi:MAG TPA: riboflavin synthase [Gemmatimonadota bacterium]|nr:riboflavin synthase [Gemmatimonadota bacterium]